VSLLTVIGIIQIYQMCDVSSQYTMFLVDDVSTSQNLSSHLHEV